MLYSLFFDFSRSLLSVADFSPRQLLHFCYYCRRTSRDTRSYNRPIKYSIRRLSLPAPDILTVHFFAHHQPRCWTFLLSTFLASTHARKQCDSECWLYRRRTSKYVGTTQHSGRSTIVLLRYTGTINSSLPLITVYLDRL